MEIDDALVDAHLEAIPSLGTFTARSFTGGDPQGLGGHPDGSLHFEVLILGSLDEVSTDLLEALDVPRGQSDPDAVNGAFFGSRLGVLVHRHVVRLLVRVMQYATLMLKPVLKEKMEISKTPLQLNLALHSSFYG